MSNFMCTQCGTAIIDSYDRYITECEHYKLDCIDDLVSKQVNIPDEFRTVINENFWEII